MFYISYCTSFCIHIMYVGMYVAAKMYYICLGYYYTVCMLN